MPNDCLASTGLDSWPALAIGLIALALGVTFFALARRKMRGTGAGVLLAALLIVGGGALAPVTSAQAAECPPPAAAVLDYRIDAELVPQDIQSGGTATITFRVSNTVADEAGTPPIVVRIPKTSGLIGATLTSGVGWVLDAVIDPANYVFTYSDPLPAAAVGNDAVFTFKYTTNQTGDFPIPATIDTGSGGDSDTSNNQQVLSLHVTEIVP